MVQYSTYCTLFIEGAKRAGNRDRTCPWAKLDTIVGRISCFSEHKAGWAAPKTTLKSGKIELMRYLTQPQHCKKQTGHALLYKNNTVGSFSVNNPKRTRNGVEPVTG